MAEKVLQLRKPLLERIQQLVADAVTADKSRFHGDLHLGQVLLVADDFLIIDFEGEPGRPISERRRKHSPLRDVAGMLRSFDYARAVALDRVLLGRSDAHAEITEAFAAWQAATSASFMTGYRVGAADATTCPADDAALARLIELFQIEKALYELRYELDNRPTWIGVPANGLHDLLHVAAG
jgi:maltose alpha-D-glucosyltransferase/alpha-amylase